MRYIIFILLCFFLTSGCKKHPLDYRSKYLGNYNFSVHKKTWILYGEITDTNYSYYGKIGYGTYDDNTININFSDNVSVEPTLYDDGSIKTQNLSGQFESTSKITFLLVSDGLGGGTRYDVSGEKTK
jgi:hypothetical protein